jgi:pimeloyl-ACP methyl ester carboxylesterase
MTAPALVLLPGLACDAELWHDVLPALAAWRPVVSDVHARERSLDAMAERLLAEHDGPLVLAGASMGGMVALHAALRAPDRVAGLALLGTTARADTPELLRLRGEAIELFEQGRAEEVLRANVLFAFHPAQQRDAALIERYVRMVLRAGAAQLVAQNRAVMARADLRQRLHAVACPTLVACGEADALTPPEHAAEIAASLPGARLETLRGAGHMLTMEQPAALGALLAGWLSRVAA